MSDLWTASFWKAAAERAIKSAAQGAIAAIGADAVGVLEVDAVAVLSAAGLLALLSLLTSVASDFVGGSGPSLGPEVTTANVVAYKDNRVTLAGPASSSYTGTPVEVRPAVERFPLADPPRHLAD